MKTKGILLYLFLFMLMSSGILLFYFTLIDYRPDQEVTVFHSDHPDMIDDSVLIDMMSWNIGYAGLSKDMDFFYDGGKQVRPEFQQSKMNMKGILQTIANNDSMHFILLQEVDFNSKRSYFMNEGDSIMLSMPTFQLYSGMNYNVSFVPIPIQRPLGRVKSGISSLMRFSPSSVVRYAFSVNFPWPKKIFMPDRCFLVSHHPLKSGKELIIMNIHNSAYDKGILSRNEAERIISFADQEYKKGNYIIAGGDWNRMPPGFKPFFTHDCFDSLSGISMDRNLIYAGWKWVYDASNPTCRRTDQPYKPAFTPCTVIDMFLISPNIEVVAVKTIVTGFENSDHQPITARFRLIN